MVHGLCPNYLNQMVPNLVQNRSQYSLRNSNNMSTIHSICQLYYSSFLQSAVRAWNNLSNEHKTSTSITEFKHSYQNVGINLRITSTMETG